MSASVGLSVQGADRWIEARRFTRRVRGCQGSLQASLRYGFGRHTATDETADETADTAEVVRVLRGFRVVYVFDIAATDGPPLAEVGPVLLTGDVVPDVWGRLAGLVTDGGFRLERGWCQGANGCTDHARRTIRVLDSLPAAAAAKTLAHEIGHLRLHGVGARRDVDRARFEVEAESVAYLVMAHLGIDAGDYSFAYLARWSLGDTDRIRAHHFDGDRVRPSDHLRT